VSSRWLICVIVKNFSKLSQTHLEISRFLDFQDGRRPPSWIFKFLNIWSPVRLVWLLDLHSVVSNFIKLVKVAEASHLTIFNMAVVRHLGFFKVWFFGTAFRTWRANMRQHAKFRRNWWNSCWDIAIYLFFKMAAVYHFGFVGQILGQPTTRIWWYLSLCKMWLKKIWLAENWTTFLKLVGSKYKVKNISSHIDVQTHASSSNKFY